MEGGMVICLAKNRKGEVTHEVTVTWEQGCHEPAEEEKHMEDEASGEMEREDVQVEAGNMEQQQINEIQ